MNTIDKINLALSYLVSLLFILIMFAKLLDGHMMGFYMSSDSLYLSSIFQDLFIDGTGFRDWHLNGQPNFFPDMVGYSLIMAVFKDTLIASFLFSILQYFALAFLLHNTFRVLNINFSIPYAVISNYLLLLFVISPVLGENFLLTSQPFMINYHTTMVIMALLCVNLSFRYLNNPKLSTLITMGVMAILGSLSDRLFLMAFTAPFLVFIIIQLVKPSRSKSHWISGAISLGGSIIGQILFYVVRFSGYFTVANDSWKMYHFENIGPSFTFLMEHMWSIIRKYPVQRWIVILAGIFVLFSVIYLIRYLKDYFRNKTSKKNELHYSSLLLVAMIAVVAFLTPVINGSYIGHAIIRYNFHALLIGSVAMSYVLIILMENFGLKDKVISFAGYSLSAALTILLIILLLQTDMKKGLNDYFNFYPERSRVLDTLKDKHDLKYGIAEYWHAKYATTFSKEGVRMYAVSDGSFTPFYHVTNENWFHDGGKGLHKDPVFNFIMSDRYQQTEKLESIFGDGIDTVYNENNIVVLKVPEFKFDRSSKGIYVLDQ